MNDSEKKHAMIDHNDVDTPERRERCDAAENRLQILAVARDLFALQGVEHTTMHEIARAAKVGQGTLYRRFAHKGLLCEALLASDIESFLARLESLRTLDSPDVSVLDKIDRLLADLIAMTDSHIPMLATMQHETCKPNRPDFCHTTLYQQMHAHLAALLRQAAQQGALRPMDADFTAHAIIAVLTPTFFSLQRVDLAQSQAQIAAKIRSVFIEPLRP